MACRSTPRIVGASFLGDQICVATGWAARARADQRHDRLTGDFLGASLSSGRSSGSRRPPDPTSVRARDASPRSGFAAAGSVRPLDGANPERRSRPNIATRSGSERQDRLCGRRDRNRSGYSNWYDVRSEGEQRDRPDSDQSCPRCLLCAEFRMGVSPGLLWCHRTVQSDRGPHLLRPQPMLPGRADTDAGIRARRPVRRVRRSSHPRQHS